MDRAAERLKPAATIAQEVGLSLGEVAERVGRSKPSVSNRIRLLELPDDVLGMVERGQLTEANTEAPLGGGAVRARPLKGNYDALLSVMPPPPRVFTLYFVEGSDELTPDSRKTFEDVFADLSKRPVVDVLVVGHTDAVGSDQFNDALARQRAESVRAALIARGIGAADVVAVGLGKRELLVPTADGVAYPRNRRF